MVEFLLSIKDKEQRQRNAFALIELMGTLNPHLRNVEDFRHKLWDHLFLISDFKLDVESPYPIPTRESLKAKPDPLPYPKKYPEFRHIGKNLEMVIKKAIEEEDPEKKEGFTQCVGNYMKLAYANWHKENVHDDAIRTELSAITDSQLQYQTGLGSASFSSGDNYRSSGSGGSNKRKNFQQGSKFKGGSNNNKGNKHNKYKNRNK